MGSGGHGQSDDFDDESGFDDEDDSDFASDFLSVFAFDPDEPLPEPVRDSERLSVL